MTAPAPFQDLHLLTAIRKKGSLCSIPSSLFLSPDPDFLVVFQNISLWTSVKTWTIEAMENGTLFPNNSKSKNKLTPVCLVCVLEASPNDSLYQPLCPHLYRDRHLSLCRNGVIVLWVVSVVVLLMSSPQGQELYLGNGSLRTKKAELSKDLMFHWHRIATVMRWHQPS